MSGAARKQIRIRGTVQGVGFRPFVANLAKRLGISGFVRNTEAGVEIEAEGAAVEPLHGGAAQRGAGAGADRGNGRFGPGKL